MKEEAAAGASQARAATPLWIITTLASGNPGGSRMTELELNAHSLPTHLARVAARIRLGGPADSGDTFLLTSYLCEAAIKTIAAVLWSGLRTTSPDNAYAVAYRLLRTDGLGEWEDAVQQMSSQPLAGYLPPVFQPTLNWLTQKRKSPADDWFLQTIAGTDFILCQLGAEQPPDPNRPRTVRHLLKALVLIRNKTKGHGAVGPEFFAQANDPYLRSVTSVVMRCPLSRARWMHLTTRVGKATVRGVELSGHEPRYMRDSDADGLSPSRSGVYVSLGKGVPPYCLAEFLQTSTECRSFHLPNGGYSHSDTAEFIDYATGRTCRMDLPDYALPPAKLPVSETHGLPVLDVQSNVFGNLPTQSAGYVERPRLHAALLERLLDRNHTIITLHGRGGIGKTSLALWAAYHLAEQTPPPFGSVVWFSARDVDLRVTGPAPVRAAVVDLASVANAYGSLFGTECAQDKFGQVLQAPDQDGCGRLFIFDNFETFADARQLHKFLDAHTHLPNKVLITSRERAFKADYPIEVRGMEWEEAERLLTQVAMDLHVEGLLTPDAAASIFKYTDGHPYVMRLLIGEMAKERRYVPVKDLLPRRIDIVNAVFERSFNRLSNDGKWVYLIATNWRSAIPELALIVVCAERDIDAEAGAEECVRLSLLTADAFADGSYCYWAPELARVFGRKKLDSDPDRLAIQEGLLSLRRFGVLKPEQVGTTSQLDMLDRYAITVLGESGPGSAQEVERLNRTLERIAELSPSSWRVVADFRSRVGRPPEEVEHALRRWVEECPFDKAAWLKRGEHARQMGEEATYVACLVSAVDADPSDVVLIMDVAFELCQFLDARKAEIPRTRRGVYLAGVRAHMEAIADQLDATSLSRLAWLFLLENNRDQALYYAEAGLEQEPTNDHCRRIVQRLSGGPERPTKP